MKQTKAQKIVIIGCGNLSWHLAKKLTSLKKFDVHVYNHRASAALTEFKTKLKCKISGSLEKITDDASFYFLCVPDRYISETSLKISGKGIILHCSGTKNIEAISFANNGVFYPVQTFSKKDSVEWEEIPILIEAANKTLESQIKKFAHNFSQKLVSASSEERMKLHLAAVLVNNFTNALYTAADEFLVSSSSKLKFELLLPLIRQTTEKLESLSPKQAQTGPAKRGDEEVMEAHLSLLKENKRLKKVYRQLSKLIKQQHSTHA